MEDVPDEKTGEVGRQAVGTPFLIVKALDDLDLDVSNGMYYPENYFIYIVIAHHVNRSG